jgi:hypothetical protein
MARNTDPDANIRDIVGRNGTESAHRVINKLSVQGLKRKKASSAKIGKVKRAKKQQPKAKRKKETKAKGGKKKKL